MKTIVVFYSGYIPGKEYGGPVTSLYHFSELFGDEYDIRIVCKNHDFLDIKKYEGIHEGWNQVGKSKVMYLKDEEFNADNFERIVDEIRPQMMYCSSIFSAKMNIPLFKISRRKKIPMILAPRGELSIDRMRSKAWKKYPYIMLLRLCGILRTIRFQATSQSEYNDIVKKLHVDRNRVYMVPNIPCLEERKDNYKKYSRELKIVATSRIEKKIISCIQLI